MDISETSVQEHSFSRSGARGVQFVEGFVLYEMSVAYYASALQRLVSTPRDSLVYVAVSFSLFSFRFRERSVLAHNQLHSLRTSPDALASWDPPRASRAVLIFDRQENASPRRIIGLVATYYHRHPINPSSVALATITQESINQSLRYSQDQRQPQRKDYKTSRHTFGNFSHTFPQSQSDKKISR